MNILPQEIENATLTRPVCDDVFRQVCPCGEEKEAADGVVARTKWQYVLKFESRENAFVIYIWG